MPHVKVPERLQEISAEFDVPLGENLASAEEFVALIERLRRAIEARRCDMEDEFRAFIREVNGIASDVLETTHGT